MRRTVLLALLPLLAGCGAGIVGGVLASKRRSSPTEVRAGSIDIPSIAFFGQQGDSRQVTISGYQAPAGGRLKVAIAVPARTRQAAATEFDQPNAQVTEVRGNATRIVFLVNTVPLATALVAEGRDLTAEDIAAQLIVRIDDVEVMPRLPLTIYKLIRAELQFSRSGATEELLSTAGGTEFACRVGGHPRRNTDDFAFDFVTFDPSRRGAVLSQRVRNVRIEDIAGSDDVLLKAVAPANAFPCRVFVAARHVLAGQSLPLAPVYYRPDIGFAVPRAASTGGGSRILVVGSGLTPLDFLTPDQPAEPNYDRIELWVEKGRRRARVAPGLIQRRPASLSRLSFEMPPPPDGRRGLATLILRVDLRDEMGGGAIVESRASDLVAYGDSSPNFGPRGVVLPTLPEHVAFGDIEGDGRALDAVACSGIQPTVNLLLASDNAMFQRFAPLLAGSASAVLERSPRRLVVEDFDGNGIPDVLVLNRGNDVTATHTLLRGQASPAPPLQLFGAVLPSAASILTAAKGDFDGNGLVDVVVLPQPGSGARPEVYLSFGDSVTGPRLVVNQLTQVTESFEVVEVADFDRDGRLDIALARGGQDVALLTLYGRGDGTFTVGESLALTRQIPNYTEDPQSAAIGLHAVGDGRLRGLALVLAGRYRPATPATVTVLEYVNGHHELPSAARTLNYVADVFVRSLSADLDNDGVRELVLASQLASSEAALKVFGWASPPAEPALVERVGLVDLGAEPLTAVRDLAFGAAGTREDGGAGRALFVVHRYLFSREDRVTPFLVEGQGAAVRLVAPDATRQLSYPVEGLALGHFHTTGGASAAADVVVASTGVNGGDLHGLQFFANDGVGSQRTGVRVDLALLPATVTTVPRALGDFVVCLDRSRVVHVVQPTAANPNRIGSLSLDPYLPAGLRAPELLVTSKLAVADVDGDGVSDLIGLLLFQTGAVPNEERGQLFVLFGNGQAPVGEFPFVVPDASVVRTASAHGEARDLVVDEFAANPRAAKLLEVAVAVGGNPNHVRFYRVDRPGDAPAQRGLRRSFLSAAEPALFAGDDPILLAAADADGDGIVELAVASRADSQLRLFTNTALVSDEVDIASFREVAGGPLGLPAGTAQIILRDVNGDGVPDLLVTARVVVLELENTVRHYLGTGTGQFTSPQDIHPLRTGDQRWVSNLARRNVPLTMAVGELNNDEAVDLVVGWPVFGTDQRNLYVLFGGGR